MNTISVSASKNYEVLVGSRLLSRLHTLIPQVTKAQSALIVSDSHVYPLYGTQVTEQLEAAGLRCCESFVFPAGEESKNGQVYLQLLNHLAKNQITRSDCIIALGGGVVGDLTGFAAATYLRGIDLIQIPTTLLAAVDSSVGGKTAIDLDAGKNLAGAFYQPSLVVCDTDTLSSLPTAVYLDGCAEVIKYAVLFDPFLFEMLESCGPGFPAQEVITRCVSLKRDVVAEDEFDRGTRQLLNLGHTLGHGIEAGSHFTVSHGQAVAIGMAMVAKAGEQYGITEAGLHRRLCSLLEKFRLPTKSPYDAQCIYTCALSDKKRSGDSVNLIIPERIGHCRIHPIVIRYLPAFIEAGL